MHEKGGDLIEGSELPPRGSVGQPIKAVLGEASAQRSIAVILILAPTRKKTPANQDGEPGHPRIALTRIPSGPAIGRRQFIVGLIDGACTAKLSTSFWRQSTMFLK